MDIIIKLWIIGGVLTLLGHLKFPDNSFVFPIGVFTLVVAALATISMFL